MANELQTKLDEILLDKNTSLLPENLKAGVTCLGVEGTLETGGSGDVKLFETEEKMQADTTAKEGDLAVVYRSETQNATADSHFQIATFPETVVLDTALTDYVDVRYSAVDSSVTFSCTGRLDRSSFMMRCYTESGNNIRIQYRSSDGITYTRQDKTGNPVYFETEIYYGRAGMWNDAIGKFIQAGGSTFEGLYEYSDNSWSLALTQLSATPEYVYGKEFYGRNGIEVGTLGTPNNSFVDTNAKIVYKIQNAYENMEPRILTDSDKDIGPNIYFIPVKKDGTVLLDTSNVTNMQYMFYSCENLTTIPLLNTSSATDMQYMFSTCTNLATIPLLDTSNVTSMSGMFDWCTNLATIPLLDTSNVTSMNSMFSNCTNLATIPLLDTSNVTNMQYMFNSCTNLTTIPLLNTSNVTSMNSMFSDCTNLATIPLLDTSNVTSMNSMFSNCTNLATIPLLDTSNVTSTNSMFSNCTNLTTIPLLNTSSATNMNNMFNSCTNLTTIPLLNTSNVTSMQYMFSGCTSLSDESLNNILAMCANAASYAVTKTLSFISLTEEQATRCQSLSNYEAFTAAGWTTGY